MNYDAEVRAWFRDLYRTMSENEGSYSLKYCRSLTDCLTLSQENVRHPEFRRTVSAITENVLKGNTLARSLELFPDVFRPVHVAVVRYGELYGEVDLTLKRYIETWK